MSRVRTLTALFAVALLAPASVAHGQEMEGREMGGETPVMTAVAASSLEFSPLEVPGFPPGLEIAAMHGDPSVPNLPYTLRLRFPDGYAFPPHYHPKAENVTVLEGTMHLAMGETVDESKLKEYAVGDFLRIEGENPHFGKVEGTTVLQLHGEGPFDVIVVEGAAESEGR